MALVVAEVVLLLAGAGYLVWGLLTRDATEVGAAVALVVLTLALAAGLSACARGLWRRRRWSRTPVLVWQVLQLSVGLPQFSGGALWAALLLTLPAAAVIAAVFRRDVVAAVDL
ncbi:hypothetical protein NUM3379_39820 [Kineococcus sp. NUM-3379]